MSSVTVQRPRGPLMMDLAGLTASAEEVERMQHPLVGGVILFARNYASPEQLAALTAQIRAARTPELLIAVDHEGGRVQRFRTGFTRLPPMRHLGRLYDVDPLQACSVAKDIGHLLATELRQHGVHLSFTPVLDLDHGCSTVIGDRALHSEPEAVSAWGGALIDGLHGAGMAACGKHFPGHGAIAADSHIAIPIDARPLSDIRRDMLPFERLPLDAVMPAHVIFPQVDARPAGFSPTWHAILRQQMKFDGVVFSDDLSMEGASVVGGVLERVEAAWQAGCDMLLVCNAPDKLAEVLDRWPSRQDAVRTARIDRLLQRNSIPLSEDSERLTQARLACEQLIHRFQPLA